MKNQGDSYPIILNFIHSWSRYNCNHLHSEPDHRHPKSVTLDLKKTRNYWSKKAVLDIAENSRIKKSIKASSEDNFCVKSDTKPNYFSNSPLHKYADVNGSSHFTNNWPRLFSINNPISWLSNKIQYLSI